MNASRLAVWKRLDLSTFEIIFAVGLISLYDFVLSDALSLPSALRHSTLLQLRALDRVVSGLEYLVPIVVFLLMLILWLMRRNNWVRNISIVYLAWVTLRLSAKVGLVLFLIIARQHAYLDVLLKDIIVLWFVIILLFSIWYWIIDGGGPHIRRDGTLQRYDFAFPQHLATIPGWRDWRPGFWDYVFLGFCGSTQFSLGDTSALSIRAKCLLMLQTTLSIIVIVFIASIATGLIH